MRFKKNLLRLCGKKEKQDMSTQSSDDDMMPLTRWSSLIWSLFHIMAATFPRNASSVTPQIISSFNNWFIATINNLPCETCRDDAIQYEQQNPFRRALVDRLTISRYMLDFHNYVNKKLGKPKWTIEMVEKHYQISILPINGITSSRLVQRAKPVISHKVETKTQQRPPFVQQGKTAQLAKSLQAPQFSQIVQAPQTSQAPQGPQASQATNVQTAQEKIVPGQNGIPGQFTRPLRFGQPPFHRKP